MITSLDFTAAVRKTCGCASSVFLFLSESSFPVKFSSVVPLANVGMAAKSNAITTEPDNAACHFVFNEVVPSDRVMINLNKPLPGVYHPLSGMNRGDSSDTKSSRPSCTKMSGDGASVAFSLMRSAWRMIASSTRWRANLALPPFTPAA